MPGQRDGHHHGHDDQGGALRYHCRAVLGRRERHEGEQPEHGGADQGAHLLEQGFAPERKPL